MRSTTTSILNTKPSLITKKKESSSPKVEFSELRHGLQQKFNMYIPNQTKYSDRSFVTVNKPLHSSIVDKLPTLNRVNSEFQKEVT